MYKDMARGIIGVRYLDVAGRRWPSCAWYVWDRLDWIESSHSHWIRPSSSSSSYYSVRGGLAEDTPNSTRSQLLLLLLLLLNCRTASARARALSCSYEPYFYSARRVDQSLLSVRFQTTTNNKRRLHRHVEGRACSNQVRVAPVLHSICSAIYRPHLLSHHTPHVVHLSISESRIIYLVHIIVRREYV